MRHIPKASSPGRSIAKTKDPAADRRASPPAGIRAGICRRRIRLNRPTGGNGTAYGGTKSRKAGNSMRLRTVASGRAAVGRNGRKPRCPAESHRVCWPPPDIPAQAILSASTSGQVWAKSIRHIRSQTASPMTDCPKPMAICKSSRWELPRLMASSSDCSGNSRRSPLPRSSGQSTYHPASAISFANAVSTVVSFPPPCPWGNKRTGCFLSALSILRRR